MKKAILFFAFLFFAATVAQAAEPIRIGLMTPLTGPWSDTGKEMQQVVELLTEEINAKGGVLGRKIEIAVVNDEGTPQGALQAALSLVKQKTIAVIGPLSSDAADASQKIINDAKIIQITNAATAVSLTERQLKYFFRICPRDDEQSRVIVQTIERMKFNRVALIHDNSLYARGLVDDVRLLAGQKGLAVVFDGSLSTGRYDYSDVLAAIKDTNPDIVFFAGYHHEAGILLRQKKEMNWNVVFIGGDGVNNPDLVLIAGKKAAEGFYFLSPPLPADLDTKEAKIFLENFRKKYGVPVKSIEAVFAGDALRVIAAAIKDVNSTAPDRIAEHLHTRFVDPAGLTGSINFNFKGDRLTDLYGVYRVDAEGRFIIQRMFQYRQIVR